MNDPPDRWHVFRSFSDQSSYVFEFYNIAFFNCYCHTHYSKILDQLLGILFTASIARCEYDASCSSVRHPPSDASTNAASAPHKEI